MIGLMLGIPLGTAYLLIKIYQVFTNKYITRNKTLLILGTIGIALLAAQINPPIGWDLYRHYEEIDRIREWGAAYAWKNGRYASYYGATALFYITSLTPWNGTLPFLTVFIELIIYEKVAEHYRKQIGAQGEGICFFLFLTLNNIVMAVSGIRNVLAVVLVNYAIWDFECSKKSRCIIDIVIALFAITIHPASGILIAIYAMSFIPLRVVSVVLAAGILPVLTNFLSNFSSSKNAILFSSAGLFVLYTKEQAGLDVRVRIASVILIGISIVVVLQIMRYEKNKDRYLFFVLLYSIGTIGMITQGLVYSRMLYGLGVLYPVILMKYCESQRDIRTIKTVYLYRLYCLIYCAGMILFQGYELARAILIR